MWKNYVYSGTLFIFSSSTYCDDNFNDLCDCLSYLFPLGHNVCCWSPLCSQILRQSLEQGLANCGQLPIFVQLTS